MDEKFTPPKDPSEETTRGESAGLVSLSEITGWLEGTDHYFGRYEISINGEVAGELHLVYVPAENKLYIEGVSINKNFQNQGYGKRIYNMIPSVALPSGSSTLKSGVKFVSSSKPSEDALRVWRSMEKDGLVHLNENGRYEFSSDTGTNHPASDGSMPSP